MSEIVSAAQNAFRALNYGKREHRPTYVGLRLLLQSLGQNWGDWVAERQTHAQRVSFQPKYFDYIGVKSLSSDFTAEFRPFSVGSPLSLLSEFHILSQIANDVAFAPHQSVYSYKWAKSDKPYLFEYYMNGYRKRANAVTARTSQEVNLSVLVLDIKSYYHSLIHRNVWQTFARRMEKSALSKPHRDCAETLLTSLFAQSPKGGIPVGPAASHVLAQFALDRVDEKLSTYFPSRYFRYVDDLVVLCSRGEEGKTEALVASILDDEGLDLNSEKSDILDPLSWTVLHDESSTRSINAAFRQLHTAITIFMATGRTNEAALITAFHDAGLSFPLRRLKVGPNGRSVKSLVDQLAFASRHWARAAQSASLLRACFTGNPRPLVRMALDLRSRIGSLCHRIGEQGQPGSGFARKRFVQRARFAFNRAIYLFPREQYAYLAAMLPPLAELHETRLVLNTVANLEGDHIVDKPGSVARSVGELCAEAQLKLKLRRHPDLGRLAVRDALSNLLLEDAVGSEVSISSANDKDAAYIDFCRSRAPTGRHFLDHSYLDELRCLQINSSRNDFEAIMSSRFDEDEEGILEALSLSAGGYVS
jgi:hypothetical protein